MRLRTLLVTVLIGTLVAPACSRGDKDDDAFVLELDGRAELIREGDTRTVEEGEHRLATGDTVRMEEGDGILELPGNRSLRLRGPGASSDGTEVTVANVPDLLAGDAVAVAGDEMRFRAGDVEVTLREGAARVQQALSVTVALYRGEAEVRSAGNELPGGLAAFRQVSISATGDLPRTPSPLQYDDTDPDPWDLEFLGEAIDLGDALDDRARGFTGQLGPRARVDAVLLRRVLPTLADEQDFDDGLLADAERSPGEALIGAAIVVEGGSTSFRARWEDVFDFRADGARWGLVALDQRVKRDALLGTINAAFGRSPILFAAAPVRTDSGPGGSTSSTTRGGDGGSTSTTTSTTRPDGGGEDPPPTTTTVPPLTLPEVSVPPVEPEDPPSGESDPPEDDDLLDVLTDVVGDLLGDDSTLP